MNKNKSNQPTESAVAEPIYRCVNTCRGASSDCIRQCIRTHLSDESLTEASSKPTQAARVSDAAVSSCLSDSLKNVGTCVELFGDGTDPEDFWGCIGGAVQVLLRCTGVTSATNSALERQIINRFGTEMILMVTETPNPQDPDRHARWRKAQSDAQAEDHAVAGAQASLGDWALAYRDNPDLCRQLLANDPEGLAVCLAGATTAFNNCTAQLAL